MRHCSSKYVLAVSEISSHGRDAGHRQGRLDIISKSFISTVLILADISVSSTVDSLTGHACNVRERHSLRWTGTSRHLPQPTVTKYDPTPLATVRSWTFFDIVEIRSKPSRRMTKRNKSTTGFFTTGWSKFSSSMDPLHKDNSALNSRSDRPN